MKFQIEPTVQPHAAEVFRRALGRYPDDYAVLISRIAQRDWYTFWIQRGAYGYLAILRAEGRPLEQLEEEIQREGMKAMAIIEAANPKPAPENSLDDYIKMRL